MPLFNSTGIIGQIFNAGTLSLTGDMQLTLILLEMFLCAICISFHIPLEFMMILVLPCCIALAAYYSAFWTAVILIIIYTSFIIAQHFLFR